MFSASCNGAATMVIKQLMPLRRLGAAYPMVPAHAEAFFRDTKRKELGELLVDSLSSSVIRSGPEIDRFTAASSRKAVCRKYQGNVQNLMNSLAIVESPAVDPRTFCMVAIASDVQKKNSALDHQRLAPRLHALLKGLRSSTAV